MPNEGGKGKKRKKNKQSKKRKKKLSYRKSIVRDM